MNSALVSGVEVIVGFAGVFTVVANVKFPFALARI